MSEQEKHGAEKPIAALAGASISIIRLSGANAVAAAATVWRGKTPLAACAPRRLMLGELQNPATGAVIDPECLAVVMPGPHSYTGEDVVEVQCHGGPLTAKLAMEALLANGARMAQPGEFTKRAFLNGRLDLTQAEAVADLVSATSRSAQRLAAAHLQGRLGKVVENLYHVVVEILAETESRLDFPEEQLDWQDPAALADRLAETERQLADLLSTQRTGEVLHDGIRLIIAGPPNAGKSSLLNRMAGQERAIVTEIPGTTRDAIEVMAEVRGIPVRLVDTAGVRQAQDVIERLGIGRSKDYVASADIVLWLIDCSQPVPPQMPPPDWDIGGKLLLVANKADLPGAVLDVPHAITISVKEELGLEALYDAIEEAAALGEGWRESAVAVNVRQSDLMRQAEEACHQAIGLLLANEWELAAAELHGTVHALGQVIGKTASPDLLDLIFSKFCIGK